MTCECFCSFFYLFIFSAYCKYVNVYIVNVRVAGVCKVVKTWKVDTKDNVVCIWYWIDAG